MDNRSISLLKNLKVLKRESSGDHYSNATIIDAINYIEDNEKSKLPPLTKYKTALPISQNKYLLLDEDGSFYVGELSIDSSVSKTQYKLYLVKLEASFI